MERVVLLVAMLLLPFCASGERVMEDGIGQGHES